MERLERPSTFAWVAAAVALAVHLLGNAHYGFFRDELYFIVCGRHPAFGYVDQPPVVPLLAAGSQLFGTSLFLLRAVSALCAAAGVWVTCRLVRALTGDAFAELLAGLATLFAPILLAFGTIVGTDVVGVWAWPLLVLLVLRLARGGDPRGWLAVGAVVGVAGNTKYSVFFFVAALLVGLLCTKERRLLASRWFVGGVAMAATLLLPNFLWQALHGFPMLELLHNGQMGKNVILSPGAFLLHQVVLLGPLPALLALLGLITLLWRAEWRWLGIATVALYAVMIVLHAKDYYPADVSPVLFAAGAVAVERRVGTRSALRSVVVGLLVLFTVPLAPLTMPVLPERDFLRYTGLLRRVGVPLPSAGEHHREAALGQLYADMHGWPELAATVARVYQALPPADRARAVIVAGNYGEASAINVFGAKDGLPFARSGHNQYFLWGPGAQTGDVVIDVGGDCGAKEHLFRESTLAATFSAPYVMPYEDALPIQVCRGITRPLADLWPSLKQYI